MHYKASYLLSTEYIYIKNIKLHRINFNYTSVTTLFLRIKSILMLLVQIGVEINLTLSLFLNFNDIIN
jgi:hypothetical protein